MLTKSLFRLAMECPVKVHYARDRRYVNTGMDDEFLEALAKGGHQVGALAKLMFRARDADAVEIVTRDRESQLAQTRALLSRDTATVFEGTARAGELLIRADVLVKHGAIVDLIEVKAKSWHPEEDSLVGRTARQLPINPDFEPYIYDLAFQHHVLSSAFPELEFRPWFLFVDKTAVNPVPGLGSRIRMVGDGRDVIVEIDPDLDITELAPPLLVQVDAVEAVERAKTIVRTRANRPALEFYPLIDETAKALAAGRRPPPEPGTVCKGCEFYCPPEEHRHDHRSGWAECMESHFGGVIDRPREESIFGFYHAAPIAEHISARRLWMADLEEESLTVKASDSGMSRSERQYFQWREIRHGDTQVEFVKDTLARGMADWQFPLHFIDFETAAPPLPFHAGMRPYQPVLFQFSHHVVEADGRIRHAHECLEVEGDGSPGIAVVRQLREAIVADLGTVLHWYPHERTVLKSLREEILAANPADARELLAFLDLLGLDKDDPKRLRDLGRLVEQSVFLPGTGGSSSMKRFLPAVIHLSGFLRQKYSRPVYGTDDYPSLNFAGKAWLVESAEGYFDPYELLDPLFKERELIEAIAELERTEGEFVANGAQAMIAYGRLMNPGITMGEKTALKDELKRYCELDTLAMVMVYEALREWLQ